MTNNWQTGDVILPEWVEEIELAKVDISAGFKSANTHLTAPGWIGCRTQAGAACTA